MSSNINSSNFFDVSAFFKDAIDPAKTDDETLDFVYSTNSEQDSSETTCDYNPLEEKIWEPEPDVVETTQLETLFFADSNFDSNAPERHVQVNKSFRILQTLAEHQEFVTRTRLNIKASDAKTVRRLFKKKYIEKNNNRTAFKITELGLKEFNKLKSNPPCREINGYLSLDILEKLAENNDFIEKNIVTKISKSANQAICKYVNKGYIEQMGSLIKITPTGLDHYKNLKNKLNPSEQHSNPKRLLENEQNDVVEPPKKKQKTDQESRTANLALRAIVIEDNGTDPMVLEEKAVPLKIENTVGHQANRASGIYVLKGEYSSLREAEPRLTLLAEKILNYLAEIATEVPLTELRKNFAHKWTAQSEEAIQHLIGMEYITRKGENIKIAPKGFYILSQLNYESRQ